MKSPVAVGLFISTIRAFAVTFFRLKPYNLKELNTDTFEEAKIIYEDAHAAIDAVSGYRQGQSDLVKLGVRDGANEREVVTVHGRQADCSLLIARTYGRAHFE